MKDALRLLVAGAACAALAAIPARAGEIAARNAKNVAEALAAVPGLRVSTGRKNEPTVYVHGFDQTRVQVLIDGVPYYETSAGKLDLAQIPTDNVARIEVTKGSASVLAGANALGGTINIISKTAGAKPFTELRAEGGAITRPGASSRRTARKRAHWATGSTSRARRATGPPSRARTSRRWASSSRGARRRTRPPSSRTAGAARTPTRNS